MVHFPGDDIQTVLQCHQEPEGDMRDPILWFFLFVVMLFILGMGGGCRGWKCSFAIKTKPMGVSKQLQPDFPLTAWSVECTDFGGIVTVLSDRPFSDVSALTRRRKA